MPDLSLTDAVLLAVVVAFFAVAWALVRLCAGVVGPDAEEAGR